MIAFFSSWAKSLGLSIVIVSLLEMLLPNNKTKKYIRTVLGIFILFNIIAPFIQNKDVLSFEEFDIGSFGTKNEIRIDQSLMDERIEKIYEDELEKDIENKLKQKGYEVLRNIY